MCIHGSLRSHGVSAGNRWYIYVTLILGEMSVCCWCVLMPWCFTEWDVDVRLYISNRHTRLVEALR